MGDHDPQLDRLMTIAVVLFIIVVPLLFIAEFAHGATLVDDPRVERAEAAAFAYWGERCDLDWYAHEEPPANHPKAVAWAYAPAPGGENGCQWGGHLLTRSLLVSYRLLCRYVVHEVGHMFGHEHAEGGIMSAPFTEAIRRRFGYCDPPRMGRLFDSRRARLRVTTKLRTP